MAFFDPSRAKEFLFISGTKVSHALSQKSKVTMICMLQEMKFLPNHDMNLYRCELLQRAVKIRPMVLCVPVDGKFW